jgi:DNA-binding SARP family transcriptional activator
MLFLAKALPPAGNDPQAAHPVFTQAARDKVTVLSAPEDYLLTEGLAATLRREGRRPIWLRLGQQDRDPGAFLASLVAAAQRSSGEAARATLERMRARPGPVYGWQPLFAQLAADLSGHLARHGALVVENVHHTWAGTGTFALFSSELLPRLASVAPCVLLASRSPPPVALGDCKLRSGPELRAPASEVLKVLGECTPALPRRARDRAAALIAGHPAVLAGLRAAGSVAEPDDLASVLGRSRSGQELLTRLATMLLIDAGRDGRRALGLALRTTYAHPAGVWAALGKGGLPQGPWLQALEDGWTRVRACWSVPLRAALGQWAMPDREMLHRAAEWLLQVNAGDHAIPLYLELGDHECAARAIAGQAETLMDLGQWVTMDGWLARLPSRALAAYPVLSYARADMAAAANDSGTARHLFDTAARQFAAASDADGACRSMLAASAAAADGGDLAAARGRARAAGTLADEASLTVLRMWATWQEGRAALAAGATDDALALFARAAASPLPEGAIEPVRLAGQLAMQVADLRRQQESHHEAEAALGHAEHRALDELLASVRAAGRRDGLPGTDGWSHTPPPLKQQGLGEAANPANSRGTRQAGSWARLRRALLPNRHSANRCPSRDVNGGHGISGSAGPGMPGAASPVVAPRHARADGAHLAAGATSAPPAVTSLPRTRPSRPELAVHLLGPLCVTVNDVPVEDWSSGRCRSLFGYLLTHRQPWPPREVLMEVFWPQAQPAASRNNLNVAIHGLRRMLRKATDIPVIVYAGGVYRLNPDLRLWLDVEDFDRRVDHGRRLEAASDPGRAAEEYEFAAGLYRGDFLAEDPYEEWAALPRERLRLAYLDALGRLSGLHFAAGKYAACAGLCQRIIERDPCREDAHRRLMRCYGRQGQPHLALMQYRACVRALAGELGVGPDPATTELRDKIRRHEPA